MEARIIDNLFLNIKDELRITIPNFYYRLLENNKFETGFNKEGEKGWIKLDLFKGNYCGDRNDANSGEIEVIKIRISDPIKMSSDYHSYIELRPSDILKIEILKRTKQKTVLDELGHTLAIEKNISLN